MSRRIFLADDDPDALAVLARLVRRHPAAAGAEVLTATCGRDALGLMHEHGRQDDLAIIDHGLTDMTGLQVARMAPRGVCCYVVSSQQPASRRAQADVSSKDDIEARLGEWLGGRRQAERRTLLPLLARVASRTRDRTSGPPRRSIRS